MEMFFELDFNKFVFSSLDILIPIVISIKSINIVEYNEKIKLVKRNFYFFLYPVACKFFIFERQDTEVGIIVRNFFVNYLCAVTAVKVAIPSGNTAGKF